MDKSLVSEYAMNYALKPKILQTMIDEMYKDLINIDKLQQTTIDLIERSFKKKKNLWELVCGVNYFLNHFRVENSASKLLIIDKAIFAELLNYRQELISHKINL